MDTERVKRNFIEVVGVTVTGLSVQFGGKQGEIDE